MENNETFDLYQRSYGHKPEKVVPDKDWANLLDNGELEPFYDKNKLHISEIISSGTNRYMKTNFNIAKKSEQLKSHTFEYILSYNMRSQGDMFECEESKEFEGLGKVITEYCEALK